MTLVDGLRAALPGVAVHDGTVTPAGTAWHGAAPAFTASPSSTQEVAGVLTWAASSDLGVLPVASGGRVRPVQEGRAFIALDTSHLTGIEEYEPADLTITAGAGTRFGSIDETLRENGQWAPFDPPSATDRSLGGFVAEAAHGPLATGYGALKNHVLGATVVTGDGRVLRLGGRVVKNVAGYDLLRPVVGGRGRLGVVTSVCLRAFPLPTCDRVLMLSGSSVEELIAPAIAVGTAPILPVSIVVAGPLAALGGRSALVVRLHGAEVTVEADRATLERHLGTDFASLGAGADRDALLDEVRDRGGVEGRSVEISVLPSRLHDIVAVAIAAEAGPLVIDGYNGRIRIGGSGLTTATLEAVRDAVERAGGALRVARWDGDEPPEGTRPREGEVMLSDRLVSIFDPGGLLWPTRS